LANRGNGAASAALDRRGTLAVRGSTIDPNNDGKIFIAAGGHRRG